MSCRLLGVCLLSLALTAGGGCATRAPQTHSPSTPVSEEGATSPLPVTTEVLPERETPASAPRPTGDDWLLEDVLFDHDSSELHDVARQTLQRHARHLATSPTSRVLLEGHCDERGTAEYNLSLGERRAAATASYLASLGVSMDRLATVSKGKEQPLCGDPTDTCRQRNRRVRFIVIQ